MIVVYCDTLHTVHFIFAHIPISALKTNSFDLLIKIMVQGQLKVNVTNHHFNVHVFMLLIKSVSESIQHTIR